MEIRARITPNIKKEHVEILPDGRYDVYVNADRKEGKANKRMIELLSKHLNIDENNISLVSGHTSKTKTLRVNGL